MLEEGLPRLEPIAIREAESVPKNSSQSHKVRMEILYLAQ